MTTTPSPDYTIVIFSGQEFSVPATTSQKEIRDALVGQGFADVASAEAKKGKRTVGDAEVETIEFVKKAGTKGLDGVTLAQLLARVPPAPLGGVADRSLLGRLERGELTFDAALQEGAPTALAQLANCDEPNRTDGERLCRTLDTLPACAAAPHGW